MYSVDYHLETVGEALSSTCSPELAKRMYHIAQDTGEMKHCIEADHSAAGSEDATYFMERVKERGGQATYVVFGTELAAGHHNEKFDIDERSLLPAAKVLTQSAISLSNK
ncbi:MAG TPA: peptidase M20, partial [Bacillota bacterium]|nr:peptidase M20 [Bacillota bacterium]